MPFYYFLTPLSAELLFIFDILSIRLLTTYAALLPSHITFSSLISVPLQRLIHLHGMKSDGEEKGVGGWWRRRQGRCAVVVMDEYRLRH